MSSIINLSDHSTLKQIGIGLTIFISGGLAGYAIFQYWPVNKQSRQRNAVGLTRQIQDLKQEIIVLKGALNDAVSNLRRELDGLKGAVSNKSSVRRSRSTHTAKSTQSTRTSGTYQTAWSGDDSASDDDFALPPDTIASSQGKNEVVDDLDAICAKSDILCEGTEEDQEEAMRILQDNEINHQESWQLLWRLARSHVNSYNSRDAYEERCCHATSALEYARRALQLKEDSSDVHKWYAISLGATTDFVGTKEKIEYGFELKEHIDRAIELDPNEPTLYFMKGRWCWGVYQLTWIERKLAATLFATPPSATIEDALESFLKAEDIQSGFYKANQFYIAKCYYEISEYTTAKKWLESASALPTINKDDRDTQAEVEQFLAKF
ncbi:unnamed protein product [Clavelina lepadiformis]|uniref:Regulator of microtubule dynamics protein 2 n=1 Tax=Clavelina lepadiformis TaxID=159417 RepID=A0ABP0FFX0_CLALP